MTLGLVLCEVINLNLLSFSLENFSGLTSFDYHALFFGVLTSF